MNNSDKFYRNSDCRFFPCHEGVEEADFNCLFCYCPLYFLGEGCGGDYVMKGEVKSCINCNRPHIAENFDEINARLKEYYKVHKVT